MRTHPSRVAIAVKERPVAVPCRGAVEGLSLECQLWKITGKIAYSIVISLAMTRKIDDLVSSVLVGLLVELCDVPFSSATSTTTCSLGKVAPAVLALVNQPKAVLEQIVTRCVKAGVILDEQASDNGNVARRERLAVKRVGGLADSSAIVAGSQVNGQGVTLLSRRECQWEDCQCGDNTHETETDGAGCAFQCAGAGAGAALVRLESRLAQESAAG